MRIEDDLPQVPVRIGKIGGVPSVECLGRWLDHVRAGLARSFQDGVHLVSRMDVVADGRSHEPVLELQPGIRSDTFRRPQGQFKPTVQVEKGDSAVVELGTDHAFRRQAQAVTVELDGALEALYAEGKNRNSSLHDILHR